MKRSGTPKIFLSWLAMTPDAPPLSPRLLAAGRWRAEVAWAGRAARATPLW